MGLKINIKIDDYKLKFWKVGKLYFSLSFLTIVIGKQIGPTKDSIGTLFQPSMFLGDQAKLLIFQCFEADISQALLIIGVYKYFLYSEEMIESKQLIQNVATTTTGDINATYIYGKRSHFACLGWQTWQT